MRRWWRRWHCLADFPKLAEVYRDGRTHTANMRAIMDAISSCGLDVLQAHELALVEVTVGEHQVADAHTALGHAYGGGSQFFAMWVVGADKPIS